MAIDKSAMWGLVEAMTGQLETREHTSTATVNRIDDEGRVWVSLPGGETETPTESTNAEVSRGDTVTVEWRGNKLYVLGNATAPATSSRRVAAQLQPVEETANKAAAGVGQAVDAAEAARKAAEEAAAAVGTTNAHFWHNENGAHVTDEEKDDFIEAEADGFPDWQPDPEEADYKPWYNVLLNQMGQVFRTGSKYLSSFTHSAIAFFDGEGNEAENIVARFGTDGAQIGQSDIAHVLIDSDSLDIMEGNSSKFHVESDLVRLGDRYPSFGQAKVELSSARLALYSRPRYSASSAYMAFFVSATDPQFVIQERPTYADPGTMVLEHSPMLDTQIRVYYSINGVGRSECFTSGQPATIGGVSYDGDSTFEHKYNPDIPSIFYFARADYYAKTGSDGGTINVGYSEGRLRGQDTASFGYKLNVGYDNQTAIGSLNDNREDNIFEVGNGTNVSNRSNAFAVDWNGNVTFGSGVADTQYAIKAKTPEREGNILFAGGGAKQDGDQNGTVVGLGAGGLTIVGAGEYAKNRYSVADHDDGSETLLLGSDTDIYLETNAQTIGERNTLKINTGGQIHAQVPTDSSLDDNGTASSVYRMYAMVDANDRIHGFFQSGALANGSSMAWVGARKRVNNSDVTNQLRLAVDKDGVRSVSLSDPVAWTNALGVGTRVYNERTTAFSLAHNAYKSIASITLAPGVWIVTANAQIQANATGRRYMAITTDADNVTATNWRQCGMTSQAVNGGTTVLNVVATKKISSETTFHMVCWQNSGSTLNAYGLISAVKVAGV